MKNPSSLLPATLRALILAGLSATTSSAFAQAVNFHAPPGTGKPSYSEAVEVKGAGVSTLYVSGLVPELQKDAAKDAPFGDTQAQTEGILTRLKSVLERSGYTMRDVVKVNVYLVADPVKGGKTDGDGFSAAYSKYFGTAETPTLPARTRSASASLTNPLWLVAIDVIAAKAAP